MKKLVVFAATYFFAAASMADERAPLPSRVEHAMEERIAAGEYPSIVVAVVDGHRTVVQAYGMASPGKKATADTVYAIGSITKTFTATLLADEVARKSLDLDQAVSSVVRDLPFPAPHDKAITFANLAEQNSGLPRLPDNLAPTHPDDPYADYDATRLKAFLSSYTLPRAPGTQYEYSNLAVGLLGYVLAQHASTTYADLLNRTIFLPLDMKHTSLSSGPGDPEDMAAGHDFGGRPVSPWHFDVLAAAGGIRSTGNDMLRYLQANMGLRSTPLSAAMRDAQSPRTDTNLPDNRIGLIWMTRHDGKGPDIIWHNGMTSGFASFIGFTADRQHGVVILTNSAVKVDDLGFAALRDDLPIAPVQHRVSLTASQIEPYQGVFQLSDTMVIRIGSANGQLLAQGTGQQTIPLYASGGDTFFTQDDAIRIDFKHDIDGKVNRLVLHQHGDHDAVRITEAKAASIEHVDAMALDTATLQSYVGHYTIDNVGAVHVIDRDGQLMVQVQGQSAVPMYARTKDHFFVTVVNAQIDFQRDAKGSVVGFVLHQGGKERHATRQVAGSL